MGHIILVIIKKNSKNSECAKFFHFWNFKAYMCLFLGFNYADLINC